MKQLIVLSILFLTACGDGKRPEPPRQVPQKIPAPVPPQPKAPPAPADPHAPFEDAQKRLEQYQTLQVAMHRNKFPIGSELKILSESEETDISKDVDRILKETIENMESVQGLRPFDTADKNKQYRALAAESLKVIRGLSKESWDKSKRLANFDRLIESCTKCHDVFHK